MSVKEESSAEQLTSIKEIPLQKDVGVQTCESYSNYPFAPDIPWITFECRIQRKWIEKTFILESGCYVRLNDIKNAFKLNEVYIYINTEHGKRFVYVSEDKDGFVKMKFKPGSKYDLQDSE